MPGQKKSGQLYKKITKIKKKINKLNRKIKINKQMQQNKSRLFSA